MRACAPGAVDPSEVAGRPRAAAQPRDIALETQHLLTGHWFVLGLGEIDDALEQTALAQAAHQFGVEEGRHRGGEASVALVLQLVDDRKE